MCVVVCVYRGRCRCCLDPLCIQVCRSRWSRCRSGWCTRAGTASPRSCDRGQNLEPDDTEHVLSHISNNFCLEPSLWPIYMLLDGQNKSLIDHNPVTCLINKPANKIFLSTSGRALTHIRGIGIKFIMNNREIIRGKKSLSHSGMDGVTSAYYIPQLWHPYPSIIIMRNNLKMKDLSDLWAPCFIITRSSLIIITHQDIIGPWLSSRQWKDGWS